MLRLPIILIAIYKHKYKLYNIAKQYKDNFTNNNSNRQMSITI